MSQQQKNNTIQRIINDNIRDYFESQTKINLLGIERNAGLEHEIKKSEIFTKLRYNGSNVLVNQKLKNGLKPDLIVIDLIEPIIYEIENGETEESIESKKLNYPFKIIHIKTDRKI